MERYLWVERTINFDTHFMYKQKCVHMNIWPTLLAQHSWLHHGKQGHCRQKHATRLLLRQLKWEKSSTKGRLWDERYLFKVCHQQGRTQLLMTVYAYLYLPKVYRGLFKQTMRIKYLPQLVWQSHTALLLTLALVFHLPRLSPTCSVASSSLLQLKHFCVFVYFPLV